MSMNVCALRSAEYATSPSSVTSRPRLLRIGVLEYRQALELGSRCGFDGFARFSCNAPGDVWPTPGHGWTPIGDRIPVSDPFVVQLMLLLLAIRPDGGRFFLNEGGAYYRDGAGRLVKFAEVEVVPADAA